MTTPTPAVPDQVDGDRMAATVAMLAADRFAGRRVGTAGGAAARAWPCGVLDGVSGERMAATVATLAAEPFTGRRAQVAGGAAAHYDGVGDLPGSGSRRRPTTAVGWPSCWRPRGSWRRCCRSGSACRSRSWMPRRSARSARPTMPRQLRHATAWSSTWTGPGASTRRPRSRPAGRRTRPARAAGPGGTARRAAAGAGAGRVGQPPLRRGGAAGGRDRCRAWPVTTARRTPRTVSSTAALTAMARLVVATGWLVAAVT